MTPSKQSYRLIPLTQGQWALVSAHRYDFLMQWKWYAKRTANGQHYYAARDEYLPNKKQITIRMHRVILGLELGDPREGDHIHGNTLDNRDSELRIADNSGNAKNRCNRHDNTSGTNGVHWRKETGKWRGSLLADGKRIRVPDSADKEVVAAAIEKLRKKYHGEFARTK